MPPPNAPVRGQLVLAQRAELYLELRFEQILIRQADVEGALAKAARRADATGEALARSLKPVDTLEEAFVWEAAGVEESVRGHHVGEDVGARAPQGLENLIELLGEVIEGLQSDGPEVLKAAAFQQAAEVLKHRVVAFEDRAVR